jgi:hypothetical protein
VGFKHLTYVHPRRNAQWVQDDINRIAIHIEWHVLDRHNCRNDTLVTVASGHLVTRLDTTLDSEVHLSDFQDTRCEVVALLELAFLVIKARFVFFLALFKTLLRLLEQLSEALVLHAKLEPVRSRQL